MTNCFGGVLKVMTLVTDDAELSKLLLDDVVSQLDGPALGDQPSAEAPPSVLLLLLDSSSSRFLKARQAFRTSSISKFSSERSPRRLVKMSEAKLRGEPGILNVE